MPNYIRFTKETLKSLPTAPAGKRTQYYDSRTRGLAVRVSDKGILTFYLIRKVTATGKTQKYRLGIFRPELKLGEAPGLSIEDARRRAEHLNTQISKGMDIARERDVKRQERLAKQEKELTFGVLFCKYINGHAKLRNKRWQDSQDNYDLYFGRWQRKPLSQVKKAEVQDWVNELACGQWTVRVTCELDHKHNRRCDRIRTHSKSSHVCDTERKHTANRNFNTFRAVWNWGIRKDHIPAANTPYVGIDTFPVKARERFIQPGDEYERIVTSINQEEDAVVRDYFLMLFECGARRSNVLAMAWDQINLEMKAWTIPDTKNGESHTLPLTDQALAIIHRRFAASRNDERLIGKCGETKVQTWVFPGTGKTGHLVSPFKCWKRIRDRAGSPDVRIHDVRRTVGSYLASQNTSPFVIAKTLGHKSLDSTKVYARMNLEPVRLALEEIKQLTQLKRDGEESQLPDNTRALPMGA